MPNAHAKLGPSGASRWLTCPASIRMAEKVPKPPSSPAAEEGTIAHELAEIEAGREFGLIPQADYSAQRAKWDTLLRETYPDTYPAIAEEMELHVDSYLATIAETMERLPGSVLMLEQRLDTGVPSSWGTSDAVILGDSEVNITDLKYGTGVHVDPVGNPQLMLYALGALDTYGDVVGPTETVSMTVFQPRIDNVATWTVSAAYLRRWRDEVAIPGAKLALSEDAPFRPTAGACRWCPAAGVCKARADYQLATDFGPDPDLIAADELGPLLSRLPDLVAWSKAVESSALDRIYSKGEEVPGWKVVRSGGRRKIADETAAIQTLIDYGYNAEDVATFKVKGLGALEKLVGKKELPDVLGDLLVKGEGSPSLAPEHDKRAAISPETSAYDDFD